MRLAQPRSGDADEPRGLHLVDGRRPAIPHRLTETADDLVFQEATTWLWNPLLSPALRSAMYKVLAATPGVTVKTGITDKTGRPAIEMADVKH